MSKSCKFGSGAESRSIGIRLVIITIFGLSLSGCVADRSVGQIELFGVESGTQHLYPFLTPSQTPSTITERTSVVAGPDDPVRLNTDVVTVQVTSAYLAHLPVTITGSHDVVIFAEVWEVASDTQATPLTSIVYTARHQTIPGVLNFNNAIAYGPTKFKGHPLKVKFTVMVLQKRQSEKERSVVDVIEKVGATAAPEYGVIVSGVASLVKDFLAAQPDVISFDYEVTFTSDRPEGLLPPLSTAAAETEMSGRAPGQDLNARRPWLRYGQYALLETSPPGRKLFGKPAAPLPAATNLQLRGGRLYDASLPPTAGAPPIDANYLLFSITPEQIAEDNSLLEQAAQRNQTTLTQLRRSDADIQAAMEQLTKDADFLLSSVLRTKIEAIADKAARQAKAAHATDAAVNEKERFDMLFDNGFAGFKGKLRATDQAVAAPIAEEIKARYDAEYDALAGNAPGNSPSSQPDATNSTGNNPTSSNNGTPNEHTPVERTPLGDGSSVTPGSPGTGLTTPPR